MPWQQRCNHRVARRVEPRTEVAEGLRRVSGAMQQQEAPAIRSLQSEPMRTLRNAVTVRREPRRVLDFD